MVSIVIVSVGLRTQMVVKVRRTPCTFIWGILFLILFNVFPLILNLTMGYAVGIRGNLIEDEVIYEIYSVTIFVSAFAYFVVINLASNKAVSKRGNGIHLHKGVLYKNSHQIERFVHIATGIGVILGLVTFIALDNRNIRNRETW